MPSGPDARIIDPLFIATDGTAEVPVIILDENGDPVAIGGGTQYDQATAGTVAQKVTMAGVQRADVAAPPAGVVDGDRTVLLTDADGKLWVNATFSTAGLATEAKQDAGNASLASIDGKITAVNTGAVVVASSALPTGAATDATVSALNGDIGDTADAAATPGSTGSLNAKQRLMTSQLDAISTALAIMDDWDETDRAKVNPIVGQAGVQGGAGASTALTQRVAIATDANAVTAVGTVADDSPTPGAPITVGGLAKSPDGTDPGNVSGEDDTFRIIGDLNRRQYINARHPNHWSFHYDGSAAQTDTSVAASPGAGYQLVITEIIFSTGAATACNIFFEEGASKILGPWYLEAVAGRGVYWQGEKFVTAATALTVTTSAAIAQSIDVQGYIQKV